MAAHQPHRTTPILLLPLAVGALILGSGQATHASRCRQGSALNGTLTPVDLSLDTVACVQRGAWTQAGLLFGVAKAYALTDAVRLEMMGQGTAQGWPGPMLPALIIRDRLHQAQVRRLQTEIRALADNPNRHRQLCSLLGRMGPPTYAPHYRVNGNWQVEAPALGADPKGRAATWRAWEQVLTRQVACSATG